MACLFSDVFPVSLSYFFGTQLSIGLQSRNSQITFLGGFWGIVEDLQINYYIL